MSASPRPQTDEAGPAPGEPSDADGWALLEGLRRRLDDQAALARKTQTQVGQLAESIAALVAEQRRGSRSLNLNSFVAYLIFTMLCGGAFYFLYQSRARELVASRDRAVSERDTAVQRGNDALAKLTARDAADAKAWDAYQLLDAGKRDEAATRLAELDKAPLGKLERELLATRARQAETLQVDSALKSAAAAFKGGRYADVVTPLEQALVLDRAGTHAPEMHYYLGVAYAKAGDLERARSHLELAIDAPQEDVRFQLASVLDRAGQWAKARAEYDRFATAHPQLGLAVYAMRRSATLARMPAVAPNAAPASPNSAPASGPASGPAAGPASGQVRPSAGHAGAAGSVPAAATGSVPATATGSVPATATGSVPATGSAPARVPAPAPAPAPVTAPPPSAP